jgi:hypothetical protein
VAKKNNEVTSPWFFPRSTQLCVTLHYFTPINAISESRAANLSVEYKGENRRTMVKILGVSKVISIDFCMF